MIPEPFIEGLRDVVPDLKVVLVLSGTPAAGLAVNLWTHLEGENPEYVEREAWRMILYAARESITPHPD